VAKAMSDLFYFFSAIGGFIVMGCTIYFIEKVGKCWHTFGDWWDETTDHAYAQARRCSKCGYTEREQWKKIKGTTT
jgi:hypothetical protein